MRPWLDYIRGAPLLLFLLGYTVLTGGPFLWVASMSLRTTAQIFANPYALPCHPHWEKFAAAWIRLELQHLLLEQHHRGRQARWRS